MQNIENVRRGRDYVWQKWKNFKKTDQKNPDPGAVCEDWFTASPLPAQIPEGGFSIWSWILTAALTFLYLKIMLDFSKNCRSILPQTEKKGMENKAKRKQKGWHRPGGNRNPDRCIWDLRFGRCIFLLCLFAEVAQCFLLPEQKIWMLILPAAAVCSFAADHRLEVRAKFLEVLCPILTFPVMLLLLVLAVLTIRGGQFGTLGEMMRPSAPGSIWIAGIAMLSVLQVWDLMYFCKEQPKSDKAEVFSRKQQVAC